MLVVGLALLLAACTEGDIGSGAGLSGSDTIGDGDGDGDGDSLDGADASPPDSTGGSDAGPPDEPDPEPCEGGVRNAVDPATGACYRFFDVPSPWALAVVSCASLGDGSHLASVTSTAEVEILQQIGGDAVDVWLGATDEPIEDTYVWITGEAFDFTNWRQGEPNDGGPNSEVGEDCMIQEVDNGGLWDDRRCFELFPYFCERD